MTDQRDRVVLDTNTILSSLISPRGPAGQAVAAAFETHEVVQSPETVGELKEKLSSRRLAAFIDPDLADIAFKALAVSVLMIEAAHNVTACRDPKDDKFLDLAVAAQASVLVSGDKDLRTLKNIHGIGHVIPIITPQQYLSGLQGQGDEPGPQRNDFSRLLTSLRNAKPQP